MNILSTMFYTIKFLKEFEEVLLLYSPDGAD